MEIEKITFPEHLKKHDLSEQQLALLAENKQQAIGIDWNIIRRQNEWIIDKLVFIHNVMADHDRHLTQVQNEIQKGQGNLAVLFKVFNFLFGSSGVAIVIWNLTHK